MKRVLFISLFLLSALPAFPQQAKNSVQGKVIDGMTMRPVPFSLIIIKEAGLVTNTKQDGTFRFEVPKPGRYSITVQSQGLQTLTTTVMVEGAAAIDFTLNPFVSKSDSGVTVRGERDLQRVSRQTMTVKQIKEVPASFGDSVNALSSLPGVNRTAGFFGPLIIRGADSAMNGYYIDDIPLFKPMHFGGIHSVISNDLMDSIDLYSSAYPSQFSNAQAAVININTVDEVKKSGGHADIGLLSANAYFESPIMQTVITGDGEKEENRGYIIGAGRYGYITMFIPFIYEHVMHQQLDWLPQYWDYQFKAKYAFNSHHSLTILAFGNKDSIDLVMKKSFMENGDDPAMLGAQIYQNDQAHSQGLYYNWNYSSQLANTLIAYSVFNRSRLWLNIPASTQDWAKDIGINSDPNIYGLKDKVRIEWYKSHCEFRGGVEATFYDFKTSGKSLSSMTDSGDINQSGAIVIKQLDSGYKNTTFGGYAENKFSFGGFTAVPGVHCEYLERTGDAIVDPRGTASYTFRTNTTVGVAGGCYSAFLQINPSYYKMLPDLAGNNDLDPQRAIHRSVSIEQKLDLVILKAEGFYNNFWDIVASDVYNNSGTLTPCYKNEGKIRTYGLELLVQIRNESDQGAFGWLSYTFNRSKYITHESADYSKWGTYWLNSEYDMPHVVKAVGGYTFGKHTLSSKFQLNSSVPYTSIVGATEDTDFENQTGKTRWVPTFGKPNTERLDPQYRLDVRYSYKKPYSWGYISWYVEAIGIVSSTAMEYKWDYRKGFAEGNPKVIKQAGALAFLPNFGVEVKF